MCYLVREQQAAAERGSTAAAPGTDGVRPRWVAAGGAALVAAVALAATLVVPPAAAPQLDAKHRSAGAAPAVKATLPPSLVVDQRSAAVDDGVPGPTEISKARAGGCEHGL